MTERTRYNTCHLCEKYFPCESVAMLHCWDLKDSYYDEEDGTFFEFKGDWLKVPL